VANKIKSILSLETINYLHTRDKFQAVSVLLVLWQRDTDFFPFKIKAITQIQVMLQIRKKKHREKKCVRYLPVLPV